jgi:hypothetical protein
MTGGYYLLGYNAVQSTDVWEENIASIFGAFAARRMFYCWFLALSFSSTLKIEAVCSSETSLYPRM